MSATYIVDFEPDNWRGGIFICLGGPLGQTVPFRHDDYTKGWEIMMGNARHVPLMPYTGDIEEFQRIAALGYIHRTKPELRSRLNMPVWLYPIGHDADDGAATFINGWSDRTETIEIDLSDR